MKGYRCTVCNNIISKWDLDKHECFPKEFEELEEPVSCFLVELPVYINLEYYLLARHGIEAIDMVKQGLGEYCGTRFKATPVPWNYFPAHFSTEPRATLDVENTNSLNQEELEDAS